MINAERSFRNILRQYGHDILLQRRLSDDFIYSENLERITTRSRIGRMSELVHMQDEAFEGVTSNVDLIYYFESNVNPKQGDRIYENNISSIDDASMFLIDFALPIRGRMGKISYWICGATRERPI